MAAKPLAHFPFLQNVSPDEMTQLNATMQPKKFARGEYLLRVERASQHVYFLRSGTVEIYVINDCGAKKSLGVRGAGEVLGEIHGIDGEGHSANVVATESCETWAMSVHDFHHHARHMASFSFGGLQILAQRTRFSTRVLEQEKSRLSSRVVFWLLELAKPYIDENTPTAMVPLRLTQSNLAEMVGCTRESVGKALRWLSGRGLISFDKRLRLTVHDVKALRKLLKDGVDFLNDSSFS